MYSQSGDTLPDIGRHFGLGFTDIAAANPDLDAWVPKPGSRITLPLQFILPESPRKGIVINLPNMRLFYYPESGTKEASEIITYPVGIGREGWSTPTGQAFIIEKRANPSWTVPDSILREHAADGDPLPKVVKAGPDNPLGQYALRLSLANYLIHGTNKPYGIGMRVSHGCVQLYPEHIEPLFNEVSAGTPVRIVNQPYLIAWHENRLYLQAHKPLDSTPKNLARLKRNLFKKISTVARKTAIAVDFNKVEQILKQGNGIPTPISESSQRLDQILANADIIRHPGRFYGTPEHPPLDEGSWTAIAGTFRHRSEADRLARIFLHQGPPIPSRVHAATDGYRVILGPFNSRKEADKTRKRVFREFEIKIALVKPVI